MSLGHLIRFGHRQEMQMENNTSGTVGFSSFGSRGRRRRGEWKQERRGRKGEENKRETGGKLGSKEDCRLEGSG